VTRLPILHISPVIRPLFGVDPTRLELVTSAMRGRLNAFAVDRGGSENRLSKPYYLNSRFRLFTSIRSGNCQRYCQTLIQRRSGKVNSQNFAMTEFSEVCIAPVQMGQCSQ
jgi:hypothetical protein